MRRRAEIVRELRELQGILRPFEETPPKPYTGAALTVNSLARRRDQLLHEFTVAEMGDLQIVLSGDAVSRGGAVVEQVVRTLDPLQRVLDSVGQALDSTVTLAGIIPSAITNRTRLRLVGTFAGSFALALAGPPEDVQLELLDEPAAPLLVRSVTRMLDVLAAAGDREDPEQAIVEQVADLGERAARLIVDLADATLRVDAPTEFVWRAPETDQDRVVSFNRLMATRLRDVLSAAETVEEEVEVRGVLEAADKLSRTFKILSEQDEVISGRVDVDVLDRLRDYFDRPVRATLLAGTSRSPAGKSATKYILTRFAGPLGE
jgi:hypothetical protein